MQYTILQVVDIFKYIIFNTFLIIIDSTTSGNNSSLQDLESRINLRGTISLRIKLLYEQLKRSQSRRHEFSLNLVPNINYSSGPYS